MATLVPITKMVRRDGDHPSKWHIFTNIEPHSHGSYYCGACGTFFYSARDPIGLADVATCKPEDICKRCTRGMEVKP